MRVHWFRRASNDLEDLYHHIAHDDLDAASDEVDRVLAAAKLLADMPAIGRPGRVHDTRELVVSAYVVAYRVRNERVEILRVLHQARKWPTRLG